MKMRQPSRHYEQRPAGSGRERPLLEGGARSPGGFGQFPETACAVVFEWKRASMRHRVAPFALRDTAGWRDFREPPPMATPD